MKKQDEHDDFATRIKAHLLQLATTPQNASNQAKLDCLNKEVTAAISKMEVAARKVSLIEEKIAELTDTHSVEGKIARRGAVRAAMAGKDEERAKKLVKRFLAEKGVTPSLAKALELLIR